MFKESDSYEGIKKAVDRIKLIDTHEHLIPEKDRLAQNVDVLATFFKQYASSDLLSSGMDPTELEAIVDPRTPLKERWNTFAPHWEKIKNTGYARALEIAAKHLYGVNGINRETYAELSRKMKQANRRGLYRSVLRDKAGIERCILDPIDEMGRAAPNQDVDRSLFAPVMRFGDFIMLNNIMDLRNLSKKAGLAIHSFQDLLKALDLHFERVAKSIFGIKIVEGYNRTLQFEKTEEAEAEKAFDKIFRSQPFDWRPDYVPGAILMYGPSLEEAKPLQDFMVHKVIQLAARYSLPVQVHTGLQEGRGNVISNSNPLNLTNLFVDYPDVRFDIFHGGYPYTGELATLGKNFRNVYVDMCWLHVISPSRARSALSEWLETVPANKILAFGGDYLFVEGTYGHSVLARENVARVLWEKLEERSISTRDVDILAHRLLRDNAMELFLSGKPDGVRT